MQKADDHAPRLIKTHVLRPVSPAVSPTFAACSGRYVFSAHSSRRARQNNLGLSRVTFSTRHDAPLISSPNGGPTALRRGRPALITNWFFTCSKGRDMPFPAQLPTDPPLTKTIEKSNTSAPKKRILVVFEEDTCTLLGLESD